MHFEKLTEVVAYGRVVVDEKDLHPLRIGVAAARVNGTKRPQEAYA
jgi:hypothetical protein